MQSLEYLLNADDLSAIDYLQHEFSPTSREWYRQVRNAGSREYLVEFFERGAHTVNIPEMLQRASACFARHAPSPLATQFDVPETAAALRGVVAHSCIVHGDLNAGNLMVAVSQSRALVSHRHSAARRDWWNRHSAGLTDLPSDWRTILIDYRHTTRGPIFTDLAALESSVRLLPRSIDRPESDIIHDLKSEETTWDIAWSTAPDTYCPFPRWDGLPYWGAVSYELIRLARVNFEMTQSEPGKTPCSHADWQREYAATCLLYALRLIKITGLGKDIVRDSDNPAKYKNLQDKAVLRLGVWIYHLGRIVRSDQ